MPKAPLLLCSLLACEIQWMYGVPATMKAGCLAAAEADAGREPNDGTDI
jgi:hypothetical protein